MKEILFGLDGGGTGSRLRIADLNNTELARVEGEGINPQAVGYAKALERIRELFHLGLQTASTRIGESIQIHDITAGCFAVAGAGISTAARELEKQVQKEMGFACPLLFVPDAEAALVGGLKKLEGIILVAGTGSVGRAIVRAFAELGARVFACDIDEAGL
ncbi:MAG: hypothetical protein SNJ78_05080, partial [Spirochaetales bacterium]